MPLTLIFPCFTPHAQDYCRAAKARGESIALASSVPPGFATDDDWHLLPMIYEDLFLNDFQNLILKTGATHIYCSSPAIFSHLRDDLATLNIRPVAVPPYLQAINDHCSAVQQEASLLQFVLGMIPDVQLDQNQLGAILRYAGAIFGESYAQKMALMAAILSTIPPGDVVEIGALFGRTASVLANSLNLAGKANHVLIVDPWSSEAAIQNDLSAKTREALLSTDMGCVGDAFDRYLLPLAKAGQFNRLRASSRSAYATYRAVDTVKSDLFGTTRYSGNLAFLHIDGNHNYEEVLWDQENWGRHLVSGGWLVHDDYRWSHGDGPRKAADKLLSEWQDDIRQCFFADGALFINKK